MDLAPCCWGTKKAILGSDKIVLEKPCLPFNLTNIYSVNIVWTVKIPRLFMVEILTSIDYFNLLFKDKEETSCQHSIHSMSAYEISNR